MIHSHLWRNFDQIISTFQPPQPLNLFLSQFFKNNKQLGSRDRRRLREMSYLYFRVAPWKGSLNAEESLKIAFLLVGDSEAYFDVLLTDFPKDIVDGSFDDKWSFVLAHYSDKINGEAIEKYNKRDWNWEHFYTKKPVWLSVRSKFFDPIAKLADCISADNDLNAVAFPPGYNAEHQLKEFQGNYYVQDWSTQKAMHGLPVENIQKVWDCCAGAGGKSLKLASMYPEVKLFCSDIRKNSLQNLKDRFKNYGLKYPTIGKIDLENPKEIQGKTPADFDLVLADVPCTGSGTWSRNPEQFKDISADEIKSFQGLQNKILNNIWTRLKPGGTLVYITCSVFSEENEEVTDQFLNSEPQAKLKSQETLLRQTESDIIYRAVFTKDQ